MAIMGFTEIMHISTTPNGTFIKLMTMKVRKISIFLLLIILTGCTLAPGMHMTEKIGESVYIETIDMSVSIKKLEDIEGQDELNSIYKIGNGDQISITVWGLPNIFPQTNISSDLNLRRVDSNGNIYFPYVGLVKASDKTQDELRSDISLKLSNFFNEPQLDVSVARFNSQKVYLLGEVLKPSKLNLTDIPLSLSDALGEVNGLNNNTSDGSKVFVIRNGNNGETPKIFLADLSSPSGFLLSSTFFLKDNDIVYVNAKGTTRWNRVISQFFPFSTFLNSIDNLTSD